MGFRSDLGSERMLIAYTGKGYRFRRVVEFASDLFGRRYMDRPD
jgi:hypothetical protein